MSMRERKEPRKMKPIILTWSRICDALWLFCGCWFMGSCDDLLSISIFLAKSWLPLPEGSDWATVRTSKHRTKSTQMVLIISFVMTNSVSGFEPYWKRGGEMKRNVYMHKVKNIMEIEMWSRPRYMVIQPCITLLDITGRNSVMFSIQTRLDILKY